MKHLLWSIILTTLVGSCAQSGPGQPPLDLNELAPVIADLQLAEALTGEVPVLVRDSMREVYMKSSLS
jgi:hypothetical protein